MCPVVNGRGFDPLAADQQGDPFPWLMKAQQETPIFYMPDHDMWCVTGYDDVMRVIRDVDTFSSRDMFPNDLHPDLVDVFPHGHPGKYMVVQTDRPEHTRLRRALQPAFTPRATAAHEPLVRQIAHDLIDGFADRGRCDLVSEFATKLPLQVVTVLCGLTPEKAEEFVALDTLLITESAAGDLSSAERQQMSGRVAGFIRWLEALIDERRAQPTDDLISMLVQTETQSGEPTLATHEIVSSLFNVLGAGATTVTAIPTMLQELLRHPDLWQAVCNDSALVESVVEEALRLREPIRGVLRKTTKAVTVSGQDLPAGAVIYAHYGAAQRDPQVFSDPEQFNPARADLGRHYAFGRGAHMCLGAPLARLELQVSLQCFIERLPGLRLARETDDERWGPSLIAPNLEHLLLEWDAEPAVQASR